MAEIINLNRARKARVRNDASQQAQKNRISFGRPKHERDAVKLAKARAEARLDAHRRED